VLFGNELKGAIVTGLAIFRARPTYNLVSFPVHHVSHFIMKKVPGNQVIATKGRKDKFHL
jgi:hypothetical protein